MPRIPISARRWKGVLFFPLVSDSPVCPRQPFSLHPYHSGVPLFLRNRQRFGRKQGFSMAYSPAGSSSAFRKQHMSSKSSLGFLFARRFTRMLLTSQALFPTGIR